MNTKELRAAIIAGKINDTLTELYGEDGTPIAAAPHPGQRFFCAVPFPVTAGDIMRGQ